MTMMEEKLNALCVRTVDYKENDRLITLCTAEKGKILVKATGCKSPKAKLKFAASPLCFGEYNVIDSGGRYTLKGCEPYDTFSELAVDIKRYYAGFSVLEWVDKLSKEGDADTCRAYMLLGVNALKDLTYGENAPERTLLKFLYEILDISGYRLNFESCAISGKPLNGKRICYDFTAGGMVLFENRSLDYIEFTGDDVALLFGGKGDNNDLTKLILNLESILCYAANVKKNYSLEQFFKF